MAKASLTVFYGAEAIHCSTEAQEFKEWRCSDHIPLTQTLNQDRCPLNYYTGHIALLKQRPLQKDNYFPYFVALLTTEIQPTPLGSRGNTVVMVVLSQAQRGIILFWMVSQLQCWAMDILDFVGHSGGGSLCTQYASGTKPSHSHVLSPFSPHDISLRQL